MENKVSKLFDEMQDLLNDSQMMSTSFVKVITQLEQELEKQCKLLKL